MGRQVVHAAPMQPALPQNENPGPAARPGRSESLVTTLVAGLALVALLAVTLVAGLALVALLAGRRGGDPLLQLDDLEALRLLLAAGFLVVHRTAPSRTGADGSRTPG